MICEFQIEVNREPLYEVNGIITFSLVIIIIINTRILLPGFDTIRVLKLHSLPVNCKRKLDVEYLKNY